MYRVNDPSADAPARHRLTTPPAQPVGSPAASAGEDHQYTGPLHVPRPSPHLGPLELEEFISGKQTAKNLQGRQRVVEGVLAPMAPNDPPSELNPADGLDFIIVDNVVSRAECAAFCEAYRSISRSRRRPVANNAYWDGRIVFAHELIFSFLPLALRMKELCKYSAQLIGQFYDLKETIYADTAQLVCWPEGMHMNPHADNANSNGAPHGMAWRRFSSVIYINEDYEGGELYFTALNKIIKPRCGRLVAFTCGFHHEHSVLKIKKGNRFTIPAFFTNDEDKANEFIYS